MRFPSIVRTLFTFANTTLHRAPPAPFAVGLRPGIALRASMPTIPFLGSLFSTAGSRNMSHPVQKSDDEWQAQLSKGKLRAWWRTLMIPGSIGANDDIQSNSASSANKAPKPPSLASTTNTPLPPASTPAPAARPRSTKPTISSSPAAVGLLFSMPCLELSPATRIRRLAWRGSRLCAVIVEGIWDMCLRGRDMRRRRMRGIVSIVLV